MISKTYGSNLIIFDGSEGTFENNWYSDSWEETNEEYYSPSSSITDSANINYSNNENSTITISNEIDLNDYSHAEVTFKAKWEIQNNFIEVDKLFISYIKPIVTNKIVWP